MTHRTWILPPRPVSRRTLLRGSVAAAVALAPLGRALAGTTLDSAAAAGAPRSLSFVHTHTGETLSTEYFCDGCYQPDAMARINHLLRDFRTGELHNIDPRVLDILYGLQVRADREATFQVISGYRSPRTNAMLHGRSHQVAEHSLHMEGEAIDIRVDGLPTARLHQLALSLARGGVGYYPASDFVHVDCGRVRQWQGS